MTVQRVLLCGAAIFLGCVEQSEQLTLCDRAQDHFESCAIEADVEFPATCDEEAAEAMLAADCSQLVPAAKGDGCNPFFWWTCFGDADGDSRLLRVGAKECGQSFGSMDCSIEMSAGSCVLVTVEDAQGREMARGFTNAGGTATFDDVELPTGEYVAKIWDREGELATMVSGDPFDFDPAEAPAAKRFAVGDDAELRVDVFMKPGLGRASLQRCADASVAIDGTCDGAPLARQDVEWAWFVSFDRVDADTPERIDLGRPFVTSMGRENRAFGDDLPVGKYELNVIEMDIPEFLRRNNPDYDDLLDRFGRDVVHTESFEVRPDDATTKLQLGQIAVDRGCD